MIWPDNFDWPQLVWLLMALLLVAGAGAGFRRFRHDPRRAVVSLLIWAAVIAAIVAAYQIFN